MKRPSSAPLPSQQTAGLALFESIRTPILAPKDTRRAAHDDVLERADKLEEMALASLRSHGPGTSDEIATRLGVDRLSIRPRMTALRDKGETEDSGLRRPNVSGKMATVWQVIR